MCVQGTEAPVALKHRYIEASACIVLKVALKVALLVMSLSGVYPALS
jgi:hypothetical protein